MKKHDTAPNLVAITDQLLGHLEARARDIIARRFGLKTGVTETLESIGREYGITRERVRQVEAQAMRSLGVLVAILKPVEAIYEAIFRRHGGLLEVKFGVAQLQDSFRPKPYGSMITFYLELLPAYSLVLRQPGFWPYWQQTDVSLPAAQAVVETARQVFRHAQHPIAEETLFRAIAPKAPVDRAANREALRSYLVACRVVDTTPFGEWGLTEWPETNPHGVGDKAYSVLRRHGKPEHFTRITDLINEAHFSQKPANAQTVHNELIKDERFVLVGRGLYGLREWGYIPGTVGDVLETILTQAKEPLTRDELVTRVLAQRHVKKNTILLGLQNSARFVKMGENRFTIRKGKN